MKRIIAITSLLATAWVTSSTPALADYYNQNCSSYGSFNNCSGYDSYGGRYNYQGSQIGNFYNGSASYRSNNGNEYENRYDVQRIGNTIYENQQIRTPYGNYNVRCTTQYIGSQVYSNCN